MLKGTLDDFTLPDILRFLASSRKTGCIEVSRSAGDGRVFLRDGEVYYGESSLTRGLDKTPDEDSIRRQIEGAFFDLLRWDLGEFTFSGGVEVEPGASVDISVESLIAETSAKLEELAEISTKIPSENAILAMAPTPPTDAQINISSDEWRVLVLVSGTRSVAEIADQVGQDSFSVMRTMYGLASTGLIEVVGEAEAVVQPEMEEIETPEIETIEADASFDAEDIALAADGEDDQPAPDAYLEALAAPLEGPALAEQMDAEFPPFEAEPAEASTNGHNGHVPSEDPTDHEDATPEQENDALPLALTDDPETAVEEDAPVGPRLYANGGEDAETESDGTSDDVDADGDELTAVPGTMADFAGAEAEPEPADIPIEETAPENVVDRLAAVKELADLFDRTDDDAAGPPYPAEIASQRAAEAAVAVEANGDGRRRVEDDEEITRGLISRLIDGVKGL